MTPDPSPVPPPADPDALDTTRSAAPPRANTLGPEVAPADRREVGPAVGPGTTAQLTTLASPSGTPIGPTDPIGIPGFTFVRLLGRGGMGAVYLAQQHTPGRLVAVKVVLAGANAGPDLLDRFRLEGEAIARLAHPGVVQVFACEQAGPVPYMVLEYIDGPSLDRTRMPVPPREAAELLVKVARAVEYAHQRGVVHRDLKPGNILLTGAGEPKVTDFGLAKFDPALAPTLNDLHATTRSGAILGSPRYMAPEQAAGRVSEIGPATDVHALGLILYELLTGKPAFEGDTLLDTLEKVRTTEPTAVRAVAPAVSRDLETICVKCLEKAPVRRYRTAAELADDLQRFLDGAPIHARPVPPWERAAKWVRRHPEDAVVRGIICFLLPPTLAAVARTSPILIPASLLNAALGATAVLRLPVWVRALVLVGGASAALAEWHFVPHRVEWAYGAFLLGAVCGATGRLAGRKWGAHAPTVAGVSLFCAGCGVLLVAVPAMAFGVWGRVGALVATAVAFAAGGIGGGVLFARTARHARSVSRSPALPLSPEGRG